MSAVTASEPSLNRINRCCSLASRFWPFANTPFKLSPPGVFELASKTMRQGVLKDPSLYTVLQGIK